MVEPIIHKEQPVVLALLDNLFFVAKLKEAAAQAGMTLSTARSAAQALLKAQTENPSIIILDLDASACQPFDFIRQVKDDEALRAIPLLGFVSHVNTGVQEAARQAGCDRVLARSVFSRDLPKLLEQFRRINSHNT